MKLLTKIAQINFYEHRGKTYVAVTDLESITAGIIAELTKVEQQLPSIKVDIESIRQQYKVSNQNTYLRYFGSFKVLLFRLLQNAAEDGKITEEGIHKGFKSLENDEDVSIPQFLINCGFTTHTALTAFISLMNAGVVLPAKEAKGASMLLTWINEGKITINDVHGAYLWMRVNKKHLTSSLMSVTSIIADYLFSKQNLEAILENK